MATTLNRLYIAAPEPPRARTRAARTRLIGLIAGLLVMAGAIAVAGTSLLYEYLTHPGHQTTEPEFSGLTRTMTADNTLVSPVGPAIEMRFQDEFTHIGGQKFILYGTAETEQHFFVEEHQDGSLKSLFWIQFESFLPDNQFTYNYADQPIRTEIDGFRFFTDTAAGKTAPIAFEWPGTDGKLARGFLRDNGYSWPDNYAYARLVHLPDEARRQELLIIFIDDLAPSGLTADDLREGGDHADRWAEIEAAHLERAGVVLELSRP